ncbi:Ribosomal L28e family protein [Acanthocheilonema viteae]
MVNVSADIQWQIIRKTSSFLRRQRGIPKHFSRERFNIKGVNSIRFNGLVHKKGLDIQASPDGKGIVVAVKKRSKTYFPSRSNVSVTLKKNSRKSLKSVKNIARSYQNAHKGLVQKRASQLLRSLKPVASRRGRHVRKAEV